jgi:hypothetical protein
LLTFSPELACLKYNKPVNSVKWASQLVEDQGQPILVCELQPELKAMILRK